MRNLLVALSVLTVFCITTCAQTNSKKEDMNNKVLVVYFSATGTTENVAGRIASVTGGDLLAIEPVQPYTSADLNWNNRKSRSSVEMDNPKARPVIKDCKVNIADYDVVFIGYPIWWDLAPRVVNTFIESHNLTGKTVIPFATSGGSTIANSVAVLKKTYPSLHLKEGRLLNHADENTIAAWLERVAER